MPGDQAGRSRTASLVGYIVDRLSGHIGRTMVLKLLYLADLEARRYLGRPLSTLSYRVYHYGPFDPEIYRALDELRDAGEIEEEAIQFPTGLGYRYSVLEPGRTHGLAPVDEAVLTYVLSTYGQRGREEVLDVVYDTEPMKRASALGKEALIPMDCVDNEMKSRLGGIDLERALAAEENVRNGRTVPWQELRRELLDRAGPGSR